MVAQLVDKIQKCQNAVFIPTGKKKLPELHYSIEINAIYYMEI